MANSIIDYMNGKRDKKENPLDKIKERLQANGSWQEPVEGESDEDFYKRYGGSAAMNLATALQRQQEQKEAQAQRDQIYKDYIQQRGPTTAQDIAQGQMYAGDIAHGNLPQISAAQAWRNQYTPSARDILTDNSLTTQEKQSALLQKYAGLVPDTQSPSSRYSTVTEKPSPESDKPTAQEIYDYNKSSFVNQALLRNAPQQSTQRVYEDLSSRIEEIRKNLEATKQAKKDSWEYTSPFVSDGTDSAFSRMEAAINNIGSGSSKGGRNYDKRIEQLQNELNQGIAAQYNLLVSNPDFAKNSGYTEAEKKSKNARYVNNDPANPTYKKEMVKENPYRFIAITEPYYAYTMDPTEQAIYNYVFNTQGEEKADEYLNALKPQLQQRFTDYVSAVAYNEGNKETGGSFLKSVRGNVASVLGSHMRPVGAIGAFYDKAVNDTVNPNANYNLFSNISSATRSGSDARIREGTSKAATAVVKALGGGEDAQKLISDKVASGVATVNSALMSGLDSAWGALIGKGVSSLFGMGFQEASATKSLIEAIPEAERTKEAIDLLAKAQKTIDRATQITTITMGAGAIPDSIREAKSRGLTDDQAFAEGVLGGLIEYGTEHLTVENLFNTDWTPKSIKGQVLKGLQQANFEGLEEVEGKLASRFVDNIIAKDKSEWQKMINDYKAEGYSEDEAFRKALKDDVLDTLQNYASGFISAGAPVAVETVGAAANNTRYQLTNKLTKLDKETGTNYVGEWRNLLTNAIQADDATRADAVAKYVEAVQQAFPDETAKRAIDFIEETRSMSTDDLVKKNLGVMSNALRSNLETIQNSIQERKTAQTQTAPAQTEQTEQSPQYEDAMEEEPSEVPSVNEKVEVKPVSGANTAQTNENIPAGNENIPAGNTAQNEAVNASDRSLNTAQRLGMEALNLQGNDNTSVQDAAYSFMSDIWNRTEDKQALRGKGIAKATIDNINARVNNAIKSGRYSQEQIGQIQSYANEIKDEIRNNVQGVQQMRVNVINDALKKYGVTVRVNNNMTDRGGFHTVDGKPTIDVNPFLDTEEALNSVVSHELTHYLRSQNRADNTLLKDLRSYQKKISQNNGVLSNGNKVDLYDDAMIMNSYAEDILREFSLNEAGKNAVAQKQQANPGMSEEDAIKALYADDAEKLWTYFDKNERTGETAEDYFDEECVSNFIEELGHDNGILEAIMSDDRNLFQRIVDAFRAMFKQPPKERYFTEDEAYKRLNDRLEGAVAKLAGEESGTTKAGTAQNEQTETERKSREILPDQSEFRMAKEIERVGDLVAVHNLDETKFLDTHELGGFPAPSIAVVKVKEGHSEFGPISVVFGSDTIDPQIDSRNRIYGGDAWTPTFPHVDYDSDHTTAWNGNKAIYDLAVKVKGFTKFIDRYAISHALTNLENSGSVRRALNELGHEPTLKLAYAAQNGIDIKVPSNQSYAALQKAINDAVPDATVREWISPFFNMLLNDRGIRNENYDPYDKSKSFSETHVPVTAENVVKAMYEQQSRRGEGIFADAEGISSLTRPEFRSMDEVRANRNALGELPDADYYRIVKNVNRYLADAVDDIALSNNGIDPSFLTEAILEAARTDHSDAAIKEVFDNWGRKIDPGQIRMLQSAFRLASQLPTTFFEAKPERVVPFSEAMYYIIPNNSSAELRQTMEQDGVPIMEYKADDEADRLKVLNSLKDVRFSKEINTAQTETEAFKNWFGDWQNDPVHASKVVNEDGTPKIMYRGDPNEINVFDRKKSKGSNLYGRGFYFTDSEANARNYGEAREYYLDVKNPLSPDQHSIQKSQMRKFLKAVQDNEDYSFENYGEDATVNGVLNDMWGKGDFEMLQDVSASAIGDLVEAIELFNQVNGTNYDGIIVPTETVVFNSNQIKSATDNVGTFDRNNPDVRYSREIPSSDEFRMSKEVERVGDLVAVHNLTEDQLDSSLELGGFPAPSIAVVKAKEGHSKYGTVSVVFYPSRIDPSVNRKNKIYGSDAYTPSFPQVGYQVDKDVAKDIRKRVYDDILGDELRLLSPSLDNSDLEDRINSSRGSFKDAYRNDRNMKYAFLKESGRIDSIPTREAQYSSRFGNAELRALLDSVDVEALMRKGSTAIMEQEPVIRKVMYDASLQSDGQEVADLLYGKELTMNDLTSAIDAARRMRVYQNKPEADKVKLNNLIDDAFSDKNVDNEYNQWLEELGENIIGNKGIRNNKDYYTSSGNPRKWNQLYDEYTLENIVKAMYGGKKRGADTFGVTSATLQSVTSPEFKNLREVKKDSARLQKMTEEEYDQIKNDLDNRIMEVVDSIFGSTKHHSDNRFVEYDIIADAMTNAARGTRTKSSIINSFSRDGYAINEMIAEELQSIYNDAAQMPTEYFEAKPERVVYFPEVAAVIVPDDVSQKTLDGLARERVKTVKYEAGNEQSRLDALNSLPDDTRFSREVTPEQDQEYLDAVEAKDTAKEERMVRDAAKKAGAATNERGRLIDLYHGTGHFGYTVFRPGIIFTSTSSSVAGGYANIGRVRGASSAYIEDDGTEKTLLRNAKNVLLSDYKAIDSDTRKKYHDELYDKFSEMADKVQSIEEPEGNDFELEGSMDTKLWDLMNLFPSLKEDDDRLFDTEHPDESTDYQGWILPTRDTRQDWEDLRDYYNENKEEIDASRYKPYFDLMFRGYEFGDAIIDYEYLYKNILNFNKKAYTNQDRSDVNAISEDDLREMIDHEKNYGVYHGFGFLGDKPFEVDAKKSFWTSIEAPEIGDGYFSTDYIVNWAQKNGYTSVIIKNVMDPGVVNQYGDDYVFFDSNQFKSADPVTYDDNGDPIKLSERFNPEEKDIRKSKELGDDYAAYNRTVLLKEDTVDKYLKDYAAEKSPNYAQAYITRMSPKQFLALTSTQSGEGIVRAQTEPMRGEELAEAARQQPIQIRIEDGEVVGHEGRHRMVAMERNGIESVPVLVFDSSNKNNKTEVPEMSIRSQEFGNGRRSGTQTLTDLVPLSYANRDRIVSEYGSQPSIERLSEKYKGTQTMRFSKEVETLAERELRRKLQKSEEMNAYLKKQYTARTAFGPARAISPKAFNDEVRRMADLLKYSNVSVDEIRTGLRELFDIFERPLKGQGHVDSEEARYAEAEAKVNELVDKWFNAVGYEKILNPEFGEDYENYKSLYKDLTKVSGYYVKPQLTAEAGDAQSLARIRKKLAYMKLLGVESEEAGMNTGRRSIDQIYTDLAASYPQFFEQEGELASGEMNGDFAKLQRIADVGELAYLAARDPYVIERDQMVDANEQIIRQDMHDDLMSRFWLLSKPTKASGMVNENDVREAYAEGQREMAQVSEAEYERGRRDQAKSDELEVLANAQREELMEQHFRDEFADMNRRMDRLYDEQMEKINRLESRIARRGLMDRVKVERNKLMRSATKLNKLLENPTRKEHIPQNLRAPVAKLLESIANYGAIRLPNGKTITAERMAEIQKQEAEAIRNAAREIASGIRGGLNASDQNLIATENFLQQLTDQINFIEDIYNRMNSGPSVDKRLQTGDIATSQNESFLNAMNKVVEMAVHAINDANKFVIGGKNYTAAELGAELTGSLEGLKSEGYGRQKRSIGSGISELARDIGYETMSPDLFFGNMGWTDTIAHAYREGQNRQAKHEARYIEYMKNLLGDYDNMNAKRELIPVKINGKELNVTRDQLMQLYVTYQRPAGRVHLENGGACFVDDKGRESRAYTFPITPEIYNELMSHLTEEDKRIADGLVRFMANDCANWGNEASMYMYGYRMYEDPNYIPLDVVNYAIPKEIADKIQQTKSIENASFTNPLKRNSTVPLRMTSLFDVANDHVRKMAAYNAYAPITNDMNRIMRMTDVSGAVKDKLGNPGWNYLKKFVERVAANEVRTGEVSAAAAPLTAMMNAYKRQAVAWNVSTMLKQPISILRAANEIDGKCLRRANVGKEEYQRIKNLMLDRSGVAYIKSNGYSDTGLGKTMEKLYTKNYTNDSGLIRGGLNESKFGRGLVDAYDAFIEKGMEGAARADEMTWVRIWKACELEVADNYPNLSGEERLQKVTERFNDVIGKTQVVDTILDSAPLMQNKAMQIFTPFMNEPTKTLGGLVAAANDWRNGKSDAGKKFGKALGLWAVANILIEPLITSLMTMWRDEKDDTEDFGWSLLEKMLGIKKDKDGITWNGRDFFTSNMVSGALSLPIVNIIYNTISNKMQGFSSEKIDTAALSNLYDTTRKLNEGMHKAPADRAKSMYRLWGDWAEALAAFIGVPAKTIRRQIAGTARAAMDMTNSNWAKWQYNKLYYNMENTTARSQKNFYDILADTYKSGDAETYQKMLDELTDVVNGTPSLVSMKTIQSAIEKGGGEIKPGNDLWNTTVQARFRLDQAVKGWQVENFLTKTYVKAEKDGIEDSAVNSVLLNMPDSYDYEADGKDVEMTAEQYDEFTRDVGGFSYKVLAQMSSGSNSSAWNKLTIDQQIYAIDKVYAYSKAKAKKDLNPDYDIRKQGVWMDECYSDKASPKEVSARIMQEASGYDKQKKRKK